MTQATFMRSPLVALIAPIALCSACGAESDPFPADDETSVNHASDTGDSSGSEADDSAMMTEAETETGEDPDTGAETDGEAGGASFRFLHVAVSPNDDVALDVYVNGEVTGLSLDFEHSTGYLDLQSRAAVNLQRRPGASVCVQTAAVGFS